MKFFLSEDPLYEKKLRRRGENGENWNGRVWKIMVVANGPPEWGTDCKIDCSYQMGFFPCPQAMICLLEEDESFKTELAIQFNLSAEFLSRGVLYKITR